MDHAPSYITLNTLAARLGLPERWLRDEADAGRLPFIRAGKRRLFNPTDVERVLSDRALANCEQATAGVSDE